MTNKSLVVSSKKQVSKATPTTPTSKLDLSEYLPKGKYDIHYVISLLKILDVQCQSKPMSNLGFTLSNSIRRLLSMLEIERDQPKEHVINLCCQHCGFIEPMFSSRAKHWACPQCKSA